MPRIGVADDKVAQYVALHYYVDKDLQVSCDSCLRSHYKVKYNWIWFIETKFLAKTHLGQWTIFLSAF